MINSTEKIMNFSSFKELQSSSPGEAWRSFSAVLYVGQRSDPGQKAVKQQHSSALFRIMRWTTADLRLVGYLYLIL